MSKKSPWLEEHTPTRIAWLELVLNSKFGVGHLGINGFNLSYTLSDDGKSIVARINYYEDIDEKIVERLRALGKKAVFAAGERVGRG